MTDHLTSPDPHHHPYANLSDMDLLAAFKRASDDADEACAQMPLAEMTHRNPSA